ncbi:MAG: TolC family protein, partial [Isosphaeraceae bacterium]|nr:TolC family protein [Isosphaeraceae bacterium]
PQPPVDRVPEVRPPSVDIVPAPIRRREDEEQLAPRRPDRDVERYLEAEKETAGFASILTPGALEFDIAAATGLPPKSRPYMINPAQALTLALINSRLYQWRLEQIYVTGLTVTLNRFTFEPQIFAGMSPTTFPFGPNGITAVPAVNPASSFLYRTRATGSPNSTLSIGTLAGFGKFFMFGGRLAAGYANQTIFNFIGSNPRQPIVQSFLPLTFVQPFLRGGGRAVTLEPLTLAERTLLYEVRNFARFRQQFIPYILTANQVIPDTSGVGDPTIGYLGVLQSLIEVENDRRIIAGLERVLRVFQEYEKGAASGISQLQVDQIDQTLQSQLATLAADEAQYRIFLDQFKFQIGMPPDVPVVLDMTPLQGFRDVYNNIERWSGREQRDPDELREIIAGLPGLEDVVIDGRSLFVYRDPERLEEYLLAAERVALENRLDLMNNRAMLFDLWRQIAITANALRGVFNVTLTNQFLTPPTTTNPFAFVDQAKQFSLVLNAELPLIRVNERNNYQIARINYRRQQRLLMSQEDNVKFQVRQEIRNLIQFAVSYEVQKQNLFLNLRLRDNTLNQIVAPPAAADVAGGTSTNQLAQTTNLVQTIPRIVQIQNQLVATWVGYQTQRLALYRDLGIMPIDEWEAYYELFPAASGHAPRPIS